MIGKVYGLPPEPHRPEDTRMFPAGAVTFGVEYRLLDSGNLYELYKRNPEQLAEFQKTEHTPGLLDQGASLHVFGEDGHEYLRFDIFDDGPHYHYNHPGEKVVNNWIEYDRVALGDMLPWALSRLRTRLPDMLTEAGGADLVPKLDPALIAHALDEVEAAATAALASPRVPAPQPVG
jgi:hypothetical protein